MILYQNLKLALNPLPIPTILVLIIKKIKSVILKIKALYIEITES